MAGWHHWLDGRWVSVNSGSWWRTGRPGVLRFMGSQRVGHDWATDLIWKQCLKTLDEWSKWMSEDCRERMEQGGKLATGHLSSYLSIFLMLAPSVFSFPLMSLQQSNCVWVSSTFLLGTSSKLSPSFLAEFLSGIVYPWSPLPAFHSLLDLLPSGFSPHLPQNLLASGQQWGARCQV